MRIAYIINSLDGYGAGLPVPMITRFMQSTGADVRLFALSRRDGRIAPLLAEAGVSFDAWRERASLRGLSWLRSRLAEYKPTLIWTSLVQATLVGRVMGMMLRTPVVSWEHNMFLKPGNVAALKATRALTHLWVADSNSVAALTRHRFRLADNDVAVWPLFKADPGAPTARPAQPGEVFRIGSLGRLHAHKGYDVLIRALARLALTHPRLAQTFSVTIGGEGPERERLRADAERLGVRNLTFAGYQENAPAFLAGLHGYVQPSRVEGLCIAAHEALQAGLPAIVSSVGEMPYSVRDFETGYVVPPEDVQALATALRQVVEDRARAAAMGAAARAYVLDRFSAQRFQDAGHAIMRTASSLSRSRALAL